MKSRLVVLVWALLSGLVVFAEKPVIEVQGAEVLTNTISLGDAPTDCTILVFTNTAPGMSSMLVKSVDGGVTWDYLVVGGGGAGGAAGGGGGGGGGVKFGEGLSLTTGENYVITVGAGAARVESMDDSGFVAYDAQNSTGGDSTLVRNKTVIARALGGGSGASRNSAPRLNRAEVASSGGGSKSAMSASDAVIFGKPVDGNQGGDYVHASADGGQEYAAGGGGGGYAGPGLAITNDLESLAAGRGGEGYPCDITGTQEVYGSGGGGAVGVTFGYPGGVGGTNAGTGSSNDSCPADAYDEFSGTPGHAGRPGYGGGGGAGAWPVSGLGRAYGGAGGSGTVIIRIRAACHIIYRWPTGHGAEAGEVDVGLLGDNGELGWKGRMPRAVDSETYFDAAGNWRAELTDGATLGIPGVTRFCPKSGVGSVVACADSRLTLAELRLCESGSGLAELRAEGTNGLVEVTSPLNVFNGHVRFVAASGGTLSTAPGVTFGGRAKSEVRLHEGGVWQTGRVTFGSKADRTTASVSVVSDGGEIVLSADASYCGDGPFVHTNTTYRVTAGRRVVLGDDTRLEFFGGVVTGGIWAVGTTGTRNALEFGGGAVFAPDTFDFATVNGAAGELDFRSGARCDCAGTLIVGSVGYGVLVVDGGIVTAVGGVRVGSKSRLDLCGQGVIEASNVTGSDGATITSDGGILRSVGEPGLGAGGFLAHIPPISCAAGGLTIDTTRRDAVAVVKASFKAADGAAGLLVKAGEGTLDYADGTCEVGVLRVDRGVFRLGEKAAIDPGCALEVNAGGTFSTAGATTDVTVASLAVNGGTIELGAADGIVVTGAVSLVDAKVRLAVTPEKDTTNTVLTLPGEVSPEVLKAWSEAQFANDLEFGLRANFFAVEEDGATRLKMVVFDEPVGNVKFRQRYPWNGLVDICFDVMNPEGETNVVVTVRDGEKEVTNFTAAVTIPASGILATNLVWDATTAGLGDDFRSDDVTVEVARPPAIPAKSKAGAVDLRANVALAEGEATVSNVTYSATAWGAAAEAAVTLGWTNETAGAGGVLASALSGSGATNATLPKKDGAYRFTHSTGDLVSFVTFTVSGYPTLKIPVGMGYSYVVSNETTGAEITGELADGTNTYAVVKGDKVKVYFVLDDGYKWVDEVTNPKTIENIQTDTVIDASDLPTAVRKVSYSQVAATEALEFKVDSRTGERVIDGSAAETLAYSAAGWDKGAAGTATIAYTLNGGASETFAQNLTGDGGTNWLPKVNGKFAFTHTPGDKEGDMTATFVVAGLTHTLTIAQTNALACVVSNETGVIMGENGVYTINAGDKIWVVFDTTEDYYFTGPAPAPTVYEVFDGDVTIGEGDLPKTEKYGELFFGLVRAAQRYPWNGKVDIVFAVTNLRPTVEYALATAFTVKEDGWTKAQTNDLPTAWRADGIHTNTVNVADESWFGAESLTNAPSKLSVKLLRR